MATYGYLRISKTSEGGLSIEAQGERVRAKAAAMGVTMDRFFIDDGESGASLDRPAFRELLIIINKDDVVVFACLDRLSRRIRDLIGLVEDMDRRGVRLVSASDAFDTSTAMGRAIIQIQGTIAELERGLTIERIQAAFEAKRQRGEWCGRPRYGTRAADDWRPGAGRNIALPDPKEQAVLDIVRERLALGVPQAAICRELNGKGLRTRSGGEWRKQYLTKIVRRIKEAA